jgi:hypothetical protein
MTYPGYNSTPGFQASDHTRPEVVIYQKGDDPIILSAVPFVNFKLDGRRASDKNPSVIGVQTNKEINSASGTFQISLKPSQQAETLFNRLVDDDWVDITFYKGADGFHTMRGLIDEVNRNRIKAGATSETFTIIGRDFGKVWECTPVWFDPYANELATSAASLKVFGGIPELYQSPGVAPLLFLRDFMEELTAANGVNWSPPLGMPGIINSSTFTGNVNFHDAPLVGSIHFQNNPQRQIYNANGLNPEGMLWQLAYEYSDPMFTELYVDMHPTLGGPYDTRIATGQPYLNYETEMSVVLRDKPFPFWPTSAPPGFFPTWNTLPNHFMQKREIVNYDVSRSGYERYNAFFVAPKIPQESIASHALYLIAPLIDRQSIKRHGLRRLDIMSNVTPDPLGGLDEGVLATFQRQIIRDWYCMNPYLLSGTISTGHGRPDIKIGNKLTIPGGVYSPTHIEGDETYYVESVTQDWQAGRGMRTSVGVTRGWIGTYPEYMAALNKMILRYSLPTMAYALP